MKLIFSRKGFDSATGGKPSPIFPDGTMVSLPIPYPESVLAYRDIGGNHLASIGQLVWDLANIRQTDRAHLDPDLSVASLRRREGWRPLFGQVGMSQRHLQNNEVGEGDVFLFFGLFRKVIKTSKGWQYDRNSRPMHVIFGWLQIQEQVAVSNWPTDKPWALDHPHFHETFRKKHSHSLNVVYVATERLSLPGLDRLHIDGAGTVPCFSPHLRLTKPDCPQPSRWLLPSWFSPKNRASKLTFHSKYDRWHEHPDGVELATVGRGQEFVLNCSDYPEAVPWLSGLLGAAPGS